MEPRYRVRGRFQKNPNGPNGAGLLEHEQLPAGEIGMASTDRPGLVPPMLVSDTPAALEAEAAAAAAAAPPDLEAPSGANTDQPGAFDRPIPGPSDEEILAGYQLICGEFVDLGANALVPAWRVTPVESGKLAGAMARALLLWFPDMIIPPKYLALLTVAGVAFEIAQARRDPQTGQYRPGKLPAAAESARESTAAPAH